jgi:hypothetical protein
MDGGAEDDAEGGGEVVVDVLGADRTIGEADLEDRAERIVAVALEQIVELVDVADPDLGRRWTSSVRYASACSPKSRRLCLDPGCDSDLTRKSASFAPDGVRCGP